MKTDDFIIEDVLNRKIRLTKERLIHIQESHAELAFDGLKTNVEQTLQNPDIILSSVSNESVKLVYRYYLNTVVGNKWLALLLKI